MVAWCVWAGMFEMKEVEGSCLGASCWSEGVAGGRLLLEVFGSIGAFLNSYNLI